MNDNSQLRPKEANVALETCFAQIRLARATELAKSERLLEAESVLLQDGELPANAKELDLLARIAARLGQFDEAQRRWKAALQLDPENDVYRRCLENLTPARRILRLIAHYQDTLLNVLVWIAIAFVVAVLVYVFRR